MAPLKSAQMKKRSVRMQPRESSERSNVSSNWANVLEQNSQSVECRASNHSSDVPQSTSSTLSVDFIATQIWLLVSLRNVTHHLMNWQSTRSSNNWTYPSSNPSMIVSQKDRNA